MEPSGADSQLRAPEGGGGDPRVPWARARGVLLSEDSSDGDEWQVYWATMRGLGVKVMRTEDGAHVQDTEALV